MNALMIRSILMLVILMLSCSKVWTQEQLIHLEADTLIKNPEVCQKLNKCEISIEEVTCEFVKTAIHKTSYMTGDGFLVPFMFLSKEEKFDIFRIKHKDGICIFLGYRPTQDNKDGIQASAKLQGKIYIERPSFIDMKEVEVLPKGTLFLEISKMLEVKKIEPEKEVLENKIRSLEKRILELQNEIENLKKI